MVSNTAQHLDATFAAIADPTRRAILARLAAGEATVMELAKPFEMTQPAVCRLSRCNKPADGWRTTAAFGKVVSNAWTICWMN